MNSSIKWNSPEYRTLRKCAEALSHSRPDKGWETRHHDAWMAAAKLLNDIGDQHDKARESEGAA